MKLTNNFNLPQPIVDAIINDDYDKGDSDYSVTELWKAPRIAQLERQHWDELEVDAIDNIWSLFGRAVHGMLSDGDHEAITEKRLYITREGKKIGGKFDRFVMHDGGIEDYKVTSVWHVVNLKPNSEWEAQLNSYSHILRENNLNVNYLRVNALLRDWSKHEAKRVEGYPQKQFVSVDLPLWEPERAERELLQRLRMHEDAKLNLPLCSDADRWAKPPKIAVMKTGRKTAVKLFDSETEAATFISGDKDSAKMYLEKRAVTYTRCEGYCPVGAAGFCSQWNDDPENPAKFIEGI